MSDPLEAAVERGAMMARIATAENHTKALEAEIERLRAALEWSAKKRDECSALNAELLALLDAARICFKNRDQSEREAAVYAAICAAITKAESK